MDEIRQESLKPNPEQKANIFSKLFFCFINSFLRLGYKRPLETKDFYQVLHEDESLLLSDRLEKAWLKEVADAKAKSRPPDLKKAIYATFGRRYQLLGLILIVEEFVKICQPVFMGRLIRYFRFCSDMPMYEAYLYASGFSMCAVLLAILHHPYFYHVQRVGMQIRVAVGGLMYKKIMKISSSGLREMEVGKIVNLLSNDVARFDQTVVFLHYFWAAPLSLIAFTVLLWYEMGPSCLAGFGCLVLLVPIQGFIGRRMGKYRRDVAGFSDKRIGIMNELLNGIRVIKMYAWETPFSQLVDRIRMQEIKKLRIQAALQGILIGLFFVTGKIIVLCALVAYILTGKIISAEIAFVASALFNSVRLTVTLFLPFAIQFYAEYKVTATRIQKFLLINEKETSNSLLNFSESGNKDGDLKGEKRPPGSAENSDDVAAEMENYCAKWSNDDKANILEHINLRVKRGQLVIIVGPVGSGKSSLLQSFCGETKTVSGRIDLKGKVVYVPQEAWIFSASVRQNVIFGRQIFDPLRFQKTVEVCAMQKDIDSFARGDATVVGDRGTSLSGGQRSRIGLARAVYYDADVYLLDDPLSAVDSAVGRIIFEKCILQHLAKSARILVTHQLQYLKYADLVVVLKDGKVAASGKYSELEKLGESFTSILTETEESYRKSDGSAEGFKRDDKQLSLRSRKTDSHTTSSTPSNVSDSTAMDEPQTKTAASIHEKQREKDVLLLKEQPATVRKASEIKRAVLSQFEDEKSTGVVNWRVYFAYFRHMGNVCSVIFLFLFCIFVQIIFNGSDWWLNIWATHEDYNTLLSNSSAVVNQSSTTEQCYEQLMTTENSTVRLPLTSYEYLYIYTGIIVILTVLSLARSVAFRVMLTRSSFVLHSRMFRAVLCAPVLFFDKNPVGRILNRFSKDTGTMDELLSFVTFDFVQGIITFFGVIVVVAILNPWTILPTLPLVCLFLFARFYYMQSARVIKRLEATTKSPVYSHLSGTLNGLSSVRTFHAEKYMIEDFHRFQNSHTSVFSAFLSTSRWFALVIDWLCSIFVALVAFISVWSASGQSAGSVGLALFYAISLLGFFQWIIRQSTEMESMMISVERILEYSNLAPETDLKAGVVPPENWPQRGEIVFNNVSLKYSEGSEYVLKNLSFKIRPGEKVGIVGRTGAGKSSILNALFRLTKLEGSVVIDDVNTQTVDLHVLRKRLAIIPQDPVLFIGSLRKNLDPFAEFSDDVIWNALDQVELKQVFKEYEEGLESPMQEGGANLSVGQRQLVCLARALLRRNKILVIDEATANVDMHTDVLIQKTIREQFVHCTVLTIAHRLNTIMDSSRVMIMEAGRLIEMDKPAILLRDKNSLFSRLVAETGPQNANILRAAAEKALG